MAEIMYACKMYQLDRVMPIKCMINWKYKIKFILECTLYSLAAIYYILYTSVLKPRRRSAAVAWKRGDP